MNGSFGRTAAWHQDKIEPMRAVRLHAKSDLQVEEIDLPLPPASG
jgi:hypothetical protein